MAKFKLLLFSLSFLLTNFSFGQNCNCVSNLEWVKKTFEENDAGFEYGLKINGKQAYSSHNELYFEKAKSVQNLAECNKLLYQWLTFFRSGHIAIRPTDKSEPPKPTNTIQQPKINTDNWETLNVDISVFEKYLDSKQESDYEGIWETKPYKIGIKKNGNNYLGFIIETEAENWTKGQIKLRINTDNGKVKSTFYLRDKSAEEYNNVELFGSNYLQIGRFTLERLSPKFPTEKVVEDFLKSMSAKSPYIDVLNKTTLILRIPTFAGSSKREIDSVIFANKELILKTENLIIDLRNNGGGSDGSYKEILPFLYTNPIRTVGVEYLSTKLNNLRMLDFINKSKKYGFDEDDKKWAKESFDKLEKHLGEFVSLGSAIVSVDTLEKVYSNPQNVGIIINENNGSTTEQFLLAAKQSKKVKLFGTTTFGVLDISNMYFVKSPCEEFELGYALSRSLRIPGMTIDKKGIQPDYYIDKSIPLFKWTEFVNDILNEK